MCYRILLCMGIVKWSESLKKFKILKITSGFLKYVQSIMYAGLSK